MYHVLLVDDEPRQLRAMSAIIKSLRPDYTLYTATDGKEAISLALQQQLDVIITDIRMPLMDGIELLEKLAELEYRAKVVLLSGYGEFSYAQKAIRIGIFDYIVKPVGKTDIQRLLDKLDEVLEKEHNEAGNTAKLVRELNDSLPAYRQELLRSWLHGQLDGNAVREQLRVEIDGLCGFVLLLKIGKGTLPAEQKPSILAHASKMANCLLRGGAKTEVLSIKETEDRLVAIVVTSDSDPRYFKKMIEHLQQIIGEIHTEFGVLLHIGCSMKASDIWAEGASSYLQAAQALDASFFHGAGRVSLYQIQEAAPLNLFDLFEKETLFANAVMNRDKEETNEFLNDLFDQISGNTHAQPEQIKGDVVRLVINRLRDAKRLSSDDEYQSLASQIHNKLNACEDYRELRHWTKNMIARIIELHQRSSQDKNSVVIQKCKDFIKERFVDDMTLETIAQQYHFNASYFSTLFKSHTGMSLTDYIIKVRMDRAEELLKGTGEKISDIARKVGYKEAGYFIRLFRREKGISPKKYRSLMEKG